MDLGKAKKDVDEVLDKSADKTDREGGNVHLQMMDIDEADGSDDVCVDDVADAKKMMSVGDFI